MPTFEFLSHRGDDVRVEARDEQAARAEAMLELWGQPDWIAASGQWTGKGLMLRSAPDKESEL